jgi:dGTPase
VPIFARNRQSSSALSGLTGRRLIHETIRRMINLMAVDLIEQTRANIAGPACLPRRRARAPRLVAYSAELLPELRVLKTFLRENLYHHYQVLRMTDKARRIIQDLFGAFMNDPRLLPPQYQTMARSDKPRHRRLHRRDDRRYAMREHRRLFAVGEIHRRHAARKKS